MNGDRERWFERRLRQRGRRALERQLEFQEAKAASLGSVEDELVRANFVRSQQVRQKLESVRPIVDDDRILEVGSGAHGLVFGLSALRGVGIDPLAVDYKRLFPKVQRTAPTVAAIGEELPFEDASFDIVLSDNVIDHATRPFAVLAEIVRVLKPGGTVYFTVNVHHPFYDLASRAHGAWNALGLRLELSAFADHTIHLNQRWISGIFKQLPIEIIDERSNVDETRAAQRSQPLTSADVLLKKVFYKNALYEVLGKKRN